MSIRSYLPFSIKDGSQRLTILIVGKEEYTEPLKLAFLSINDSEYKNKIQFSFCKDVEEILSYSQENMIIPDYITYVIDPTNKSCLEIAEENIRKVDPAYISAARFCLVNGFCTAKSSEMGVGLGHINILAQKYSSILINGDVMISDKCLNLVSRILVLATTVCGYKTGIPITLDIPGHAHSFI